MELRLLRYFIAVYETGSLSAAAKRSYIAQPSISTAIDQLESILGVKLFKRHSKGVHATDEGERLYPLAKSLLANAESVRMFFKTQSQKRIVVKVSVIASVDMVQASQCLKELITHIPGLDLRVVTRSDSADIRLTSDHEVKENDIFVALWKEGYVAAVPLDHSLSQRKCVNLDELLDYSLIERVNCEFHSQMMELISHKQGRTNIAAKVQNEEWAVALVAAGIGVAIVPESSVRKRPDVSVCGLNVDGMARKVGFAYDRKRILPPTVIAALQEIKSMTSGRK